MKRPGRPMFRVVLLLLAWAAAGAIVNVAVAWVLLVYAPQAAQTSVAMFKPPPGESQWGWDVFRYDSGFAVRTVAHVRRASQLTLSQGEDEVFPRWSDWSQELDAIASSAATEFASGATGDASHPLIAAQMFEACGWPMLSVQTHWDGRNASVDHTKRWRWGISRTAVVPMSPSTNGVILNDLKVIPYGPMWPGFAINTLFYAAMLWLLFTAPFALRRRIRGRRIKRGLCPKCAYDLRGRSPASDSSVCPECGTAVTPRA